jgi:hypothetical protein
LGQELVIGTFNQHRLAPMGAPAALRVTYSMREAEPPSFSLIATRRVPRATVTGITLGKAD